MAKAEIADIHASGRTPVLAGGTGLYLRTLLDGIAPVPAIDPDIRARVRAARVEDNRTELEKTDPEAAARLNPADAARTARALEVVLSTGRTLSEWQKQREGGIGGQVNLSARILLPPRDWLYSRCDERFAAMLDQGAVEEVQALLARKLNPNLPVMRGIGVREIALGKTALDREMRTVSVSGHDVAVKLALLDGEVLNAQPEYEDVARVALATGRPIKQVLAEAIAATQEIH